MDDMFTLLAKNTMTPLGGDFHMFPAGNLANASDRWSWIDPVTANGILHTWNTAPLGLKSSYSASYLKDDALRFTNIPLHSIQCNDHQDVP